jgi:tetratricopeptide (TPR) repeat protein
MEEGGGTKEVTRQLEAANERAWLALAEIASLQGDNERAVISYKKVVQHNPTNMTGLLELGVLHKTAERYAKASECFLRMLKIENSHGVAWAHLGYCYMMMSDLQNAYSSYQHALYHLPNPKDPSLWYSIGLLYDRYGSLEHADEALEAVLKMDPNFAKAREVKFRLGVIAKQRGDYPKALVRLEEVLNELPENAVRVDVLSQIGHIYELQNNFNEAKVVYEKVVEMSPEDSKALQQLGWLCHKFKTPECSKQVWRTKAICSMAATHSRPFPPPPGHSFSQEIRC